MKIFLIYFLKDCINKGLKIYKSISIENFKPATMSHKMAALKVFAKLQKSLLLIANIVKGAVPWKIMQNTFNFLLKNWISYWQIRFWSYYAFSLNQMSDIPEVWKYWPFKDGFSSISQKLLQGSHFVVGGRKNFKILADIFFWEWLSKCVVLSTLLLFSCACY